MLANNSNTNSNNNSGSVSSVISVQKNKTASHQQQQQSSNEKFVNLGFESLKISAGVPFNQLRNPILTVVAPQPPLTAIKATTTSNESNNKDWVNWP